MELNEIREGMIMLKDGQVITVRNGELVLMEEETTMPDGTRVMPDGTVFLTDGKTRMLTEGETLTLDRETDGAPADAEDMSDRQFEEAMEDEESRDELQ